ncbi:DUF2333 family protein [Halomonas halocynthiae]|uniref:DUF2333 family protein n=1 Tax=Halomonas halocynthiae TaxID=176290 RepID=UPI00042546A7|nr:DUF2333 family protein [Halomonas halocynthiae]
MALNKKRSERRREKIEVLERPRYDWLWKPLLVLVAVYLLVVIGLGIWWSRTPEPLVIEESVVVHRGTGVAARGAVTTVGLMAVVDTLLNKPGGYLRNDIAPPGVWLDNMPAWELGVLQQARQLALAMPGMSAEPLPEIEQASDALLGNSRAWFYPSTEHRLNTAGEALGSYLQRLEAPGAQGLAAGGQGLSPWLYSVADSLDRLSYRLSASLGNPEALADLDVDVDRVPGKTPWYDVDNVFFEARGQAWALLSLLKAVRHDQADVLEAHGLTDHWDALIAELQASQRRLWSPVVLNGSGFGMFANHSLVMANHLLGARDRAQALADTLGRVAPAQAVTGGERVTLPEAALDVTTTPGDVQVKAESDTNTDTGADKPANGADKADDDVVEKSVPESEQ